MSNTTRLKVAIYTLYFVFALLLNSVGILIQRSINTYNVTEIQASSLEAFKDLSIAIVSFIVGSLLPRLGYKKGLVVGLMIVILGCLTVYFGNSFWAVQFMFACVGMSFAVIKVAVYTLISTLSKDKTQLNSFLSSVESFFMVGIAAAAILFPMFYSESNPNAWLNIYLIMAVLLLFVLLFVLSIQFDNSQVKASTTVNFIDQFKLLGQPMVIIFALCAFFYVMTEQGIMSWLPTFNEKVLHLPEKLSVNMSVILTLSIALGRYLSSLIVKKVNWLYILLVCLVASFLMIVVVLPLIDGLDIREIKSFSDIPLVGFVFPLIGLFLAPIYPLMNAAVLGATDEKLFAQMAGILTFFSALGGTFGSRIVGTIFEKSGGEKAFYFALIPLGVLFFTLIALSRYTKGQKKQHA